MFCSNCGTRVKEDDNFCYKCGESIQRKDILYFSISENRLLLLSILTLNLYMYYWFYQNWKAIKVQGGGKILPLVRTIFAPIVSYPLFRRILDSAKEKGFKKRYSAGTFAIYFFVFSFMLSGLDGAFSTTTGFVLGFIVFSALLSLPLLGAQEAINFNNYKIQRKDPRRKNFTIGEVIILVVALLLWWWGLFS